MGLILKQELFYSDYTWNVIDRSNHNCEVGIQVLTDRTLGNEILQIINTFCEIHSLKHKYTASKVERMIREEMPYEIRHLTDILCWLEENWNNCNSLPFI